MATNKIGKCALIYIAINTASSLAFAGEVMDFKSPRVLSLAGNGRGGPLLTDTIHQNPAMLGFQQVQAFQASYSWLNVTPIVPSVSQRAINFSVVDGRNEYAVAGVSLTRKPDIDLISIGVAKKLTDWISIGGSAKRYNTRPAYRDIVGDHTGYDGGLSVAISSPAEVTYVPVQVGISLDNIVRRNTDEPFMGGRKIGVGVKTNLKNILSVYADYTESLGKQTLTQPSYGIAAELALGADFFARGGISGFEKKSWGLGGGWMGPKLGINYGYQKRTSPREGFEHSVSAEIYM